MRLRLIAAVLAAVYLLPVHPTQIYSALFNLGIFFWLLLAVGPKKRFDGQLMASFLLWYAVGRFTVEIFRADPRGGLGSLSTSQVISVLFAVAALVWMAAARKRVRVGARRRPGRDGRGPGWYGRSGPSGGGPSV